ncbi:MAG TPA: hypothetical protein VGC76_04935 [Pyrinomonadaceae bacterium]
MFYKKSFGVIFLILLGFSAVSLAQNPAAKPTLVLNQENKEVPVVSGNNLYCAGYISPSKVNTNYEIVGAENEQEQFIYAQGNYVYISVGASKGVKVGDMFSVIRPRARFRSEFSRKGNLGVYVQEVGAVEVVKVKNEVSVARVTTSCDNFLLGDLLQPVEQRTSPMFTQRPSLDVFAESSGKVAGRIVLARDGQEMVGREQIVYIDLGAEDNVKVGDYFTIFRPLGEGNLFISDEDEIVAARNKGFQSSEYKGGTFSSNATRKAGDDVDGKIVTTEKSKENRPKNLRKVVGELLILNVKERTATAVIVRTAQEIHTGDMVELQ